MLINKIVCVSILFIGLCDSRVVSDPLTDDCDLLPNNALAKILGSAFNNRYMSVEMPPDIERVEYTSSPESKQKRFAAPTKDSFYVNSSFAMAEPETEPAWTIDYIEENLGGRHKRMFGAMAQLTPEQLVIEMARAAANERIETHERPWNCDGRIKWLDLGKDYFPRYLRSIECYKKTCWYGHYVCMTRSFTLKVLRRRQGLCANNKINESRELWVWEEKNVDFFCDCVLNH